MKSFKSKLQNAAGRIKDGIERSVLADGNEGRDRSRRSSRSEAGEGGRGPLASELDEDTTHVRLPLEAARKLRCFSKGDVGEIIARHLKEKEELLAEIHALRDLCLKCAPHMEVKKIAEQSKATKITELTRITNSLMLLSAKDEIEHLRKSGNSNSGRGGQTSASGSEELQKKVAALEWKLEEAESEVTMLREELADSQEENQTLQKDLTELKKAQKQQKQKEAMTSSPASSTAATASGPKDMSTPVQPSASPGGSENTPSSLPVDFDFFSDSKSDRGESGKKIRALETKVMKLKQEMDLKCAECDASLARLSQTTTSLQAQQRKNKEIQKQYRLLKARHQQAESKRAAEKANQPKENGDSSKISLEIQIQDQGESGSEDGGSQSSTKSDMVVQRLEYEIQEMRTAQSDLARKNAELEEKCKKALEDHLVMKEKFSKQQKIGKNQRAKIENMQLDIAHEQEKTRHAMKTVEEKKEDIQAMQKLVEEGQKKVEKLTAKEIETRKQLAEATAQVFEQKSKEKSLKKNQSQSQKDHSKEMKTLTSKLEASKETIVKLEEIIKEREDSSKSMEALKKEADTLKTALDAAEKQLSDQQKEHHAETQDLRDKAQDELQETVELLRQMEDRASTAEEKAQDAQVDLQNLKDSHKQSSASMIENFSKLIISEDRSTWTSQVLDAVKTVEERVIKRTSEELQENVDQLKEKMEELKESLEAKNKELNALRQVQDQDKSNEAQQTLEKEVESLKLAITTKDSEIEKQKGIAAEMATQLESSKAEEEEFGSARALHDEIKEWKAKLEEVNTELKTVRSKARLMMEAKDKELQASKAMSLLDSTGDDAKVSENKLPDVPTGHEDDIRALNAKLEEANKLILFLQNSLEDSERTHDLRDKSEQVLKEEIYEMQRSEKRGKVDLTYVKNVVLKGFESGELSPHSPLLSVLSRLLEFSPEELGRIPKQSKWQLPQLPEGFMSPSKLVRK